MHDDLAFRNNGAIGMKPVLYGWVVPLLGDTVSSAAALLAGPVVGLTSLLVQKVLKDPIGQIIAYEYSITGTWDNPVVTKLKRSGGEDKTPESGG